jgi:hypothetical protein
MNKYSPLYRYLAAQPGREIRLTFGELERILGDALPTSARHHRAWWGNQRTGPRPHAQAWLAAGWKVQAVDLGGESVRFRRE